MIDRVKAVEQLQEISLNSGGYIDYTEPHLPSDKKNGLTSEDTANTVNQAVKTLGFSDKPDSPDAFQSLLQRSKLIKQEYQLLVNQQRVFQAEIRKFDEINLNKPEIRRWTQKILQDKSTQKSVELKALKDILRYLSILLAQRSDISLAKNVNNFFLIFQKHKETDAKKAQKLLRESTDLSSRLKSAKEFVVKGQLLDLKDMQLPSEVISSEYLRKNPHCYDFTRVLDTETLN